MSKKASTKKRAKSTEKEPVTKDFDFLGEDIEVMTAQVMEQITLLRKKRKHLILVIDEIDSFSRSGQ